MRLLIFTLTMLIASSVVLGQQIKLTGIDKFQIDSTKEEIISSISKSARVKIKETDKVSDTRGDVSFVIDKVTTKIYKLKGDAYPRHHGKADVSAYYINILPISTGISLKKLYLFFYKGVLFQILCNADQDLSLFMDNQFGKGLVDVKEKTYNCRSFAGVEYKEIGKSFYTSWEINNPLIHCSAINSSYYDSKCEEQIISVFDIHSISVVKGL